MLVAASGRMGSSGSLGSPGTSIGCKMLGASPEAYMDFFPSRFGRPSSGGESSASRSFLDSSPHCLPYDETGSPPPWPLATRPEATSRVPCTPPRKTGFPKPPLGTLSPPPALPSASSTFFLETHSLSSNHSLLSDIPSFNNLRNLDDVYPQYASPSPARSQAISLTQSTKSRPQPRPSMESNRSSSSHRAVTVQQLALDLPLARSRSSSLSALIRALEDASPGWYQSLMDSVIPQGGPPSPKESPLTSPPQSPATSPPRSSPATPWTSPSRSPEVSESLLKESQPHLWDNTPLLEEDESSEDGLPPDMLAHLEELEQLAIEIGLLPHPRPPTLDGDALDSLFLHPAKSDSVDPFEAHHCGLFASLEERSYEKTVRPSSSRPSSDTSSSGPASPQSSLSPASQHAFSPSPSTAKANLVQHPKLAKTLGLDEAGPSTPIMRSPGLFKTRRSSRGLSTPMSSPTKPSPAKPSPTKSSPTKSSPTKSPPTRSIRAPATPVVTAPRKEPSTPPKTPRTLKLHAFFRRRPSMPAQPLPDSSARPTLSRRAVTVPETGENGKLADRRGGNIVRGRSQRHLSGSAATSSSATELAAQPSTTSLASFLQMM
ncbi:uncharacterized protein BXZ73DRAFT_80345 [Epithele typhae]|uniref:uncharacterized protein n=1 Tax=Epithele typhae TaxID=378194 RepID=UPI0020089024|nr:uncharacterized protein BXZ73DRAFT_80345 [Epithele typhae]KAH9919473.1 hypothetical protein BXZ73DRAFT_80345 [Epithele typhae]